MTRLLVVLAALLVLAAPAGAATPRADFADIEDEVMCVSCNVALNIAESPQASQQKDFIRRLVAEGKTKRQVLDELVTVYGANVLATPKADDGIGLAAWLVPGVAGVAALALLAVLLPRWRRTQPSYPAGDAGDGGPDLDPGDAERLDADLREHDR